MLAHVFRAKSFYGFRSRKKGSPNESRKTMYFLTIRFSENKPLKLHLARLDHRIQIVCRDPVLIDILQKLLYFWLPFDQPPQFSAC